MLKPALPESFLFSTDFPEEVSTRAFIAQGRVVYNETRSPTSGPKVVEILYNI
jgi:hypothetical protein